MIREAHLYDVKQLSKIHIDTWQTTYKGLLSDDFLSKLSYQDSESVWFNLISNKINKHLVIEINKIVVGFISFGTERTKEYPYLGEITAIYVLKDHQQKGYGMMLFKAAVKALKNDGINSLIIWMLKDNQSMAFYQKLGGRVIASKTIYYNNEPYQAIAFGWDDLEPLT